MYNNNSVEKQMKKIIALSETVESYNGRKRNKGEKHSF